MKKILVIKGKENTASEDEVFSLLEEAGFAKTTIVLIFASALSEQNISNFDCAVILAEDRENLSHELQDAARHCIGKGLRVIYLLAKATKRVSIGGTNYGPSVPWQSDKLCDAINNDNAVDSISPNGDVIKTTSSAKGVSCNT